MIGIFRWLGEDSEVRRFRIWASVFVLWLFSGVYSCDQIRYELKGETVTARRVGSSDGSRPRATYEYVDRQTGERHRKVIESRDRAFPAEIELLYIPGAAHSYAMIAGGSKILMYVFLALTVAAVAGIGWMAFSGRRPPPAAGRRSARR